VGDRATTALADTSSRLELADEDVIDLRSQLTDAQHLLDERAATIAQLQAELAASSGETPEELMAPADRAAIDPVDVAADAATAPDTTSPVDEFDIDETEVTDEVLAPPGHVAAAGETATEPVEAEPVAAEEGPVDDTAPAASAVAVPSGTVADEGPFVPPPDAQPDDLRRIRGIGPAMERLLNEQGIVTFRQLALLNDAGVAELEKRLPGVPGRVRRDRWVEQAQKLHVETHGDPI
jgi:predicted flap endonuclease-1-like 5' DNA nuclease